MDSCSVSVVSYYIIRAYTSARCISEYDHTPNNITTSIASLLGVKFGVSQMTSHAGGGDDRRLLGVGISQLLRAGGVG